ncbi:MAG: DNA-formamidopyrimidine glycosylase [Acholeplasmatales bacterium]|jgi:formamidopyrimidine-DNA glycosylase|nr:DNA-formamidopyrimidine glycosylase [Acholeplasmatales bacterium]
MPELPEVQSLINKISPLLIKQTLQKVEIFYDKILDDDPISIINQEIIAVQRWGKSIIIVFSNQQNLIVHLRMEGKFFIRNLNYHKSYHDHLFFYFPSFILVYNDTRKFGKMAIRSQELLYTSKPLLGVAPDCFSCNAADLYNKLTKIKKPIKEVLLDQSVISGVGNIYADEILFASGIFSTRLSCNISQEEGELIFNKMQQIFEKSIQFGGTTFKSFSALESPGHNQENLMVYNREGKSCLVCGNTIKKMKLAGRGTYYCDKCQK